MGTELYLEDDPASESLPGGLNKAQELAAKYALPDLLDFALFKAKEPPKHDGFRNLEKP